MLKASGISPQGKLRRFSIDIIGDNYSIPELDASKFRPPEPDRHVTDGAVRRELEEEFRLENVTIEHVRFKELSSGLRIVER